MTQVSTGTAVRFARGFAFSWLASLPVLAGGMACFWIQRDPGALPPVAVVVGAIVLLAAAFVVPAGACEVAKGRRADAIGIALVAGKAIGIAALGLVLGSLLPFVEALRPETVHLLDDSFATSHLLAAAVPTVLAAGAYAFVAWVDPGARRPVTYGVLGVLALLGPTAWWWCAGIGFAEMRYSNADAILLMVQTITLAALLFACVANAGLCALRAGDGGSGAR